MDPRLLARAVAAGRLLIGAAVLAKPEMLVRWVGRDGARPSVTVLSRALGARDLVLGAGAIASDDAALPAWLLAAIGADSTDFISTVLAGGELPFTGRVGVGATALAGALLGAGALAGVQRGS